MEHVVLLPHVGSASVHTRNAMGQLVVDNLVVVVRRQGPADAGGRRRHGPAAPGEALPAPLLAALPSQRAPAGARSRPCDGARGRLGSLLDGSHRRCRVTLAPEGELLGRGDLARRRCASRPAAGAALPVLNRTRAGATRRAISVSSTASRRWPRPRLRAGRQTGPSPARPRASFSAASSARNAGSRIGRRSRLASRWSSASSPPLGRAAARRRSTRTRRRPSRPCPAPTSSTATPSARSAALGLVAAMLGSRAGRYEPHSSKAAATDAWRRVRRSPGATRRAASRLGAPRPRGDAHLRARRPVAARPGGRRDAGPAGAPHTPRSLPWSPLLRREVALERLRSSRTVHAARTRTYIAVAAASITPERGPPLNRCQAPIGSGCHPAAEFVLDVDADDLLEALLGLEAELPRAAASKLRGQPATIFQSSDRARAGCGRDLVARDLAQGLDLLGRPSRRGPAW